MSKTILLITLIFSLVSFRTVITTNYTPTTLFGEYDKTIVSEGVDIPDYIQQTTITLNKDSSFSLYSFVSDTPENTITGTWAVAHDTLVLHMAMVENMVGSSTLIYKIKSPKTLLPFPYNHNTVPFKKKITKP